MAISSDVSDWMYLKEIVGNYEGLIEHYFVALQYFGPWFRQAGVSVVYSLGLAFLAFNTIKSSFDRLKSALSTLGMIGGAGFLLSPTTATNNLGAAAGTELSFGGYYAFVLAGSMTDVFNRVIDASWNSQLIEAGGKGIGPVKDAIAIAYNDQSAKFADKYLTSEGNQAVKDYQQLCGKEALQSAKTSKDHELLKSIGIEANTLGTYSADATNLIQQAVRARNGNVSFMDSMAGASGDDIGLVALNAAQVEQKQIDDNRSQAEQYLVNLPSANSKIDGTKGYRIPTSAYYKNALSPQQSDSTSEVDSFKKLSSEGGKLNQMLANGATSTTAGSAEDYVFYPKNCYDLYLVANETMSSFRQGVKGLKEYKDLDQTQALVAMSAANKVQQGIKDQVNQRLKQLGIDDQVDQSGLDSAISNGKAFFDYIGNKFNKWMLEFKIPAMIAGMALLSVILLITFPIFAVISVVFGHKVLVTYFKLVAVPFLVVFVNEFLLVAATNLISFDKAITVVTDTTMPGGVNVPAAMSAMNTETIVLMVICVCELAIVRLILWDDVKSVTSFRPGDIGSNASSTGMKIAGKALEIASTFTGRAAKIAASSAAREKTNSLNTHLASINQSVVAIAQGGMRLSASQKGTGNLGSGQQGGGSQGGGSQGSGPSGSGSQGSGPSGSGGNRLIPPKP